MEGVAGNDRHRRNRLTHRRVEWTRLNVKVRAEGGGQTLPRFGKDKGPRRWDEGETPTQWGADPWALAKTRDVVQGGRSRVGCSRTSFISSHRTEVPPHCCEIVHMDARCRPAARARRADSGVGD